MDACHRKLIWNRPNQAIAKQLGFKEFMWSAWSRRDSRSAGRWVNVEELNDAIKEEQRKQNGGIESAEQSAFDRLLNSRDGLYDLFRARSRALRDGLGSSSFWNNSTLSEAAPQTSMGAKDSSEYNTNSEPEYDIDPITNKKVFRKPVDSFRGYRAQFQSSIQTDPTREILEESETQSYKPFFAYEPDGKIPNKVEDGLKDFDSAESYEPYFAYEPDGKIPDPVQDGLREFDSGESYKPYFAYEPDGKIPDAVQEGLKEYEIGVSYEPYFAYKLDGKTPDPVEEGLKEYEASVSYEPYFAYEPDGHIPDSAATSHVASQNHVDPCPVQQGLKDHDDRTSYGPVMYREPDGKLPEEPCPVQEGLKAYDNITSYKPRAANDPLNNFYPELSKSTGGLHDFCCRMSYGTATTASPSDRKPTILQDESDRQEDLDLLRASDVRAASGILKGVRKETEAEKLAKRRELEDQYQQLSIENSELQNIASHLKGRINDKIAEVSSKLPSDDSKGTMTGNYVRDFPEDFEAKWTVNNNGAESLTPQSRVDAWGYDKTPQGLELSYEQEVQSSEKEFIDGLGSANAFASKLDIPRIQTSLDRSVPAFVNPAQEVREIRARYAEKADTAEEIKLQTEIDPYSKEPQGLETNFAEEKQLEIEIDPYSKTPQGLETHFLEEQQLESRLEKELDPYSKEPQGLETLFAEERKLEHERDPYSKLPQGLETSYTEECAAQEADALLEQEARLSDSVAKKTTIQRDQGLVHEVRSIYEDAYGKIDSLHRQAPEAAIVHKTEQNTQDIEPTVYTILAYDPTTQSVSTAETTSIVPDTAQPLTPAEALLRLSSPAKFIPHFGSLQAEGYEIVSGSEDVLVWRKVRPSAPMPHLAHTKAMNPIDGTRSAPIVATGNFASPTGFVNHDILDDSEHDFKSNIDVRREEDVFSGKSSWSEDAEQPRRKKMGTGKKMLIGAAWLGGLSYTLGVVSEYFKTGGIDGLGPQGF